MGLYDQNAYSYIARADVESSLLDHRFRQIGENVPREYSDEAHRPHEKLLHHAQPYKVQSCVEP